MYSGSVIFNIRNIIYRKQRKHDHVKRFDYEFQAACVKEQNFEKLEMYVMDLLMGD